MRENKRQAEKENVFDFGYKRDGWSLIIILQLMQDNLNFGWQTSERFEFVVIGLHIGPENTHGSYIQSENGKQVAK